MTKYICDMTAPKQVAYFLPLIKALREKGHKVFVTTREHRELNQLQKEHGIKAWNVGRWADNLEEKLYHSLDRTTRLTDFVLNKGIDAGISLSSVELPRVMFGLDKPLFIFNDIPTLNGVPLMQSRLTLPLASLVFAPFCIPKREFRKTGYTGRVLYYPCLDPLVWLKNMELEPLNKREGEKWVFLRESELKASYLYDSKSIVEGIASEIEKKHRGVRFIIKKRYEGPMPDLEYIAEVSGKKLFSFMAESNLFIGGGGTMNVEASYFGTPTLYCRPKTADYEKWIIRKNLGYRVKNVKEGARIANRVLSDPRIENRARKRAKRVFSRQHFPVEEIIRIMEGEVRKREH